MKLHRLELEGFGPFRDRQLVDFDAFADDGIFLIAGRTGAGKSSVLDGVCYALYGGVPRYEGAERRLRSDHSSPDDPSEVALEFSAEGERWRVTRSPEYERPKRRGGGFTKEPHRAVLERLDGEQWVGDAARPVDVAARLDEILGLTQQQFLQVILLAQNRFARFLLAKNDERQALLRTLFATRTYEEYERELESRRKDAERALASEGEGVRVLVDEGERMAGEFGLAGVAAGGSAGEVEPGAGGGADAVGGGLFDASAGRAVAGGAGGAADAGSAGGAVAGAGSITERIAALVRAVERAEYRVDTLARDREAAETALNAATEAERAAVALRTAQEQRSAARATLSSLDEAAPSIAADRSVLALAQAAEALRSSLENVDRAEKALRRAEDAENAALARWTASGEIALTAEALRDRDDELTAAIAATDSAVAVEAELEALESDLAASKASLSTMEAELAELAQRRAPIPALLARLESDLAAVAGASSVAQAAQSRLTDLRRRREAAVMTAARAEELRSAERDSVARATTMQHASAALTALLQRRLDGAAGDLARTLVDGEPCPVCGALYHPHPAAPSGEPVGDDEIARAEAVKDAAIEADRAASAVARAARDAHAVVAAQAGGDDVATLDAACAAAETALESAALDVAAALRLTTERDELTALATAATAEHERLSGAIAAARQRAALAEQRATAARATVDAARGAFGSVSERRADALARRDAARSLADASAERALLTQVRADAVVDRDARIAASRFENAEAARAALLDPADRARLDARVREHEGAERVAKERLLELELALVDAPDELVELAGPAEAVRAARERCTAAIGALAAAAGAADRLRDLTQRADIAARGVAELADRHAVIARLAHTVAGRAPNTHRMTLETFVLAAELEEIVTAANLRLDEMSSGRYRLQHSDALAARGGASGLGLDVMDAFTGQPRPPQSLSGGESFLASLALALGLAEVVTARAGGLRLDTLFIDEGFGSLDDDTLDLAMRTLDELRQGGRTVGVISHVASMKEQVPAQLVVEATAQGPSVIRHHAAARV